MPSVPPSDRLPGARDWTPSPPEPDPDPGDWLNVQRAACELNVSISTLRRMIRKGRLRNRIVPRRGGYAYLIYLPGSRHARGLVHAKPFAAAFASWSATITFARRNTRASATSRSRSSVSRNALARALKQKQTALPDGAADGAVEVDTPYARYRWLARKRRWWPF